MTDLVRAPALDSITLSQTTIHNPAEPRHFMALKPIERMVIIMLGNAPLVETRGAVRLVEIGRDVYQPAVYVPMDDVKASLVENERTSHCPLKGDAIYFDLMGADGEVHTKDIAWAYPEPFDFAPKLAGLMSFYTDKLTIVEAPG